MHRDKRVDQGDSEREGRYAGRTVALHRDRGDVPPDSPQRGTACANTTPGPGQVSRTAALYESRPAPSAVPAAGKTDAVTTPRPPKAGARGLLAADGPVAPEQMLVSTFREQASTGIRTALEAALGPLAFYGSPAVDRLLAALIMPGGDPEAAAVGFAPAVESATTAPALLAALVDAVRARLEQGDDIPDDRGVGARLSATGEAGRSMPPAALMHYLPDVRQVLAELGALIDAANWNAMRPGVVERASVDSRAHAKARRDGDLPDLTGLGSVSALDQIARDMREVQGEWSALTPGGRKERVREVANYALQAADVPPLKEATYSTRRSVASFFFPTWSLLVQRELFEGSEARERLDEDRAAALASTTAHEARHAEEYFLAARVSAANGADIPTIAATHGFPTDVAEAAHRRKLDGAPEQVKALAHQMYQATITDYDQNRKINKDNGYVELEQRRADAVAARDRLASEPTVANLEPAREAVRGLRTAMVDVEEKYDRYRAMPHEADAHEVGDAEHLAFLESKR